MEEDERLNATSKFSTWFGKWLTIVAILGAIIGTIYWKWYAIPIAIGGAFLVAAIFGRIFVDPLIKKQIRKSS